MLKTRDGPRQVDVSTLRLDLREIQSEAILPVGLGLWAAALIILLGEEMVQGYAGLLVPLGLLVLLPVAASALTARSYLAAVWTLVAGLIAVLLIMVVSGAPQAVYLLAFPAALAAFFVNLWAGAAVASFCTALLLPFALPMLDPLTRVFAIVQVWGTVALMTLAQRPLLTVAAWSWSSYERSRDLLEQARDYQVQLKQALQDLAEANRQLTRLNEHARVMRQVAEEARRAKEQFVANVSHELRTPLNMILGFTEMMTESVDIYGQKLPPALLADLAVIRRNSQHLASLIDDVLDLSQIESGHMALSRERVSIPEVVDAAVIGVTPLFRSKGLYLEKDVPADLPLVYCDRVRIREVILNLLSNAGRFTERGGVRVQARRDGNDIIVSVTDTGPGIKPADKERLFQPFQQADGSIRRRYGGTGLGLSISKSFIELHGGSMWLESTVGVGTTVFFRIPIDPPDRVQPDAAHWLHPDWEYEQRVRRSSVAPTPVRPRLVIWEAADTLQRLLGRYMDRVELVHAKTLDEARAELERVPSQALVVNQLAVGTSLQMLNESGNLPSGVPVIVCSLPDMQTLHSVGVSGYLVKPIARERLLAALDDVKPAGKTILIVDDEPEAIRLFRRMLASSGRGYRVLTATDGEHAMSVLRAEHPDAVLLDLIMPGMDGWQVLAKMNEDPTLRGIPVVIVSAQDQTGQPIVSQAMGITLGGGLSVRQILSLIEAAIRLLSPMRLSDGSESPGESSGSPASLERQPPPGSAPAPLGA